jgi:hypothetical protein
MFIERALNKPVYSFPTPAPAVTITAHLCSKFTLMVPFEWESSLNTAWVGQQISVWIYSDDARTVLASVICNILLRLDQGVFIHEYVYFFFYMKSALYTLYVL